MSELNAARMKRVVLLAALAVSSIAHGYAQTSDGAFEVGVEGGACLFLAIGSGGHESIGGFLLTGEPHVDYYLSKKFAVGVTGFFYRSLENDLDRPFLTFGGGYSQINYHPNAGHRVSPYVGARIGVFIPNADLRLFSFGAQLGLKYFVSRHFSINGQLEVTSSIVSEGTIFLSCAELGFSYHTD